MKLLDWMQHKFRQTNDEPLKEFAPRNSCSCLMGQPPLDDLQHYPKSHYYAKASSNTQRNKQFRKSFACIETAKADNEHTEDALSELFHGLLAIGTLATTEPVTPTFATSVDNITEKETEATENELKFINNELEKVLSVQDVGNDSSGRSSHASTITLSGKPLDGAVDCPLQGYLFGSAIGLPETATAKKEHRTSLGDLFQKTKIVEEKPKEKETDKSAVYLMKKMLKRRTLHSSSRRSTAASGGTIDSASADKKLHKILHMFHRKVHPQGQAVAPKSQNQSKHITKKNLADEDYKNRKQMMSEDIMAFPQTDVSKKNANCHKSNVPRSTFDACDSDGNREFWIKSDSEYLVLEL